MLLTNNRKTQLCCLVLLLVVGFGWLKPAPVSAASQVRITEIMYDPSGDGSREFIEFYNGSDSVAVMSGWTTFGVDFVFPPGTSLAPGSYVVIARNQAALQATHPGARIAGQYAGKLRGSGELLRLSDTGGASVSQVSYSYGGAWPTAPRNGGPSLSLIRPQANETLAGCWGSSTASGGSPGFANSVTGGGGCSDTAYPFTPAPVAASPSPAAPNSSNTGAAAPAAEAAKKKAEEQKKQEQAKVAEAAKAQNTQAATATANSRDQNNQQDRQKWAIVYISIAVLMVGGAGTWLIARYRRSSNAKLVLAKGKKLSDDTKPKTPHN